MTYGTVLLVTTGLLVAPGLAMAQETANATFVNAEGQEVGSAKLTNTPHGVLIAVDVTGLPAGEHAFHVHETGQCDVSGKFESAGSHFAPGGSSHGFFEPGGPHAGDMANQLVKADGTLQVELFNPQVSLGSGENTLFDADGSALVIHADPDDYKSQPSGNAGARIACAVIEKP